MSLNFVKLENLRHRSELPVSISNHEISIIFVLRGGGGGGAGFRPIILEKSILRYGLKRKDKSRLFRVVLGRCAQCCPCEASEQKMGPKTKIYT